MFYLSPLRCHLKRRFARTGENKYKYSIYSTDRSVVIFEYYSRCLERILHYTLVSHFHFLSMLLISKADSLISTTRHEVAHQFDQIMKNCRDNGDTKLWEMLSSEGSG